MRVYKDYKFIIELSPSDAEDLYVVLVNSPSTMLSKINLMQILGEELGYLPDEEDLQL